MSTDEFKKISELLMGNMICQSLLIQYLIKNKTVNKKEITNALDFMVDSFNEKDSDQYMSSSMVYIRAELEKDFVDFPPPPPKDQRPKNKNPDWFQGLIQGGKK